jgi:hypothetical protein
MATKKAPAKVGSPEAFVKDMQKVLKKHGLKASVKLKADGNCKEGYSLQPVTVTKPNGDVVTELRCVKNKN